MASTTLSQLKERPRSCSKKKHTGVKKGGTVPSRAYIKQGGGGIKGDVFSWDRFKRFRRGKGASTHLLGSVGADYLRQWRELPTPWVP